ncbi:hypothetical protein TL16_g05210 [Triparma laevis f. inornata]|uniref:Alpha-N-acetylglucosaminidase n=1 Tax=Triparma laevis f. inornata TaxID=1714386 RepID=A0A9W7ABJ5_9STRA|nr:hypothetical protein TL16_g05210 [Triparma laevis f. inornata]
MKLLTLLLPTLALSSSPGEDAAFDTLTSILGDRATSFELVEDKTASPLSFTISPFGEKIKITAESGVSLCAGAYDYLKSNDNLLSWAATGGDSLNLLKPLTPPASPITKQSPYEFVYYNNVCTYGYSGYWWWNWERWERELNLMAMQGINFPLLVLGQEFIWNQVWLDYNLSQSEINDWNAGPAFAAWFYMGNLKGWEGPISLDYQERTRQLQKKILEKARALGMKPVLPSFSGFVPDALAGHLEDSSDIKLSSGWNSYDPVNYVEPTSDLFSNITSSFMSKFCAEFGCEDSDSNYWAADLYNELSPPSADLDYLSSVPNSVYAAMQAVDPNAIWVTQGWMFHSDPEFWQGDQIKAFVTGVSTGKLIVLDLHAEQWPIYKDTDSFYGTPFIFDTIFNFGGRSGMYGRLEQLTNEIAEATEGENTLVGIGVAPEAIETNPISYDLQFDHVFNPTSHDIDNYVEKYVARRYSSSNSALLSAWKLLEKSVYNFTSEENFMQGAPGNIIVERPQWNATQVGCCAEIKDFYDFQDVVDALRFFLEASDDNSELEKESAFRFDVLNTGLQAVTNYAYEVYTSLQQSFESGDKDAFESSVPTFMKCLSLADAILADQPERMLGFWIENARLAGGSDQEKDQMEENARMIVTVWGPNKDASLHEYAFRLWNGLIDTFYSERWSKYFATVTENWENFDQSSFDDKIKDWEWQWNSLKGVELPTTPNGQGLEVAKQIYDFVTQEKKLK